MAQAPVVPSRLRDADTLDVSQVLSERNADEVVRTWSPGWKDPAVTPRLSSEVKARVTELTNRVNQTQLETYFAEDPSHRATYEHVCATQGAAAAQALLRRGEHEKGLYGTDRAVLRIAQNLPPALATGPFQPGAALKTTVRFSHGPASRKISDEKPTHPGLALRFTDGSGKVQDILLSTGSSGFVAKDGLAAVVALEAQSARAARGPLAGLAKLLGGLFQERGPLEGATEALRLAKDARAHDKAGVSLADATYFSKVPFQLGDHAVKLRLVPKEVAPPDVSIQGFDGLRHELRDRLRRGPVVYQLQIQGYKNRRQTPMDDARVVWDSPYVTLGELTLPEESNAAAQDRSLKDVNAKSFTPFNRWDAKDDRFLKPLGPVNEVREFVYEASASFRGSGDSVSRGGPYQHGG